MLNSESMKRERGLRREGERRSRGRIGKLTKKKNEMKDDR